jgi:xylulokinase
VVVLGLDVGTAGAHAVAIDHTGTVVASAFVGYATQSPRPGWYEQDPQDWWRAASQVLARVTASARGDIGAFGLTGQPGSVFVDSRGDPVRPAILGGDRRAASRAEFITDRIGHRRLIEITGGPALPGHQAPAILWLRDVEPVQFRHTHRVLPPKDYVRLLLTGEAATDRADAAGTLLLDQRRRGWSDEILDALEIPKGWMPPVHESIEIAGGLRPSVAGELGLPAGLPVATGTGTTAALAVSTGIVAAGPLGSSIERGGVLFSHIDDAIVDLRGRLRTASGAVPQRYQLTGTTPSAGASLRWWRNILGGKLGYAELCGQAESVAIGADGLFFVPQVDGDGTAPADAGARGAFVGLGAHHHQADLTRAILEGVIFSLRERLDVMRGFGIDADQVRATGGGARSLLWRQMQADIFGLPVAAMAPGTSPALGAALLAGVATAVFTDVAAASATGARIDSVIEPDPDRVARYEQLYRTFSALDPAIRQPVGRQST